MRLITNIKVALSSNPTHSRININDLISRKQYKNKNCRNNPHFYKANNLGLNIISLRDYHPLWCTVPGKLGKMTTESSRLFLLKPQFSKSIEPTNLFVWAGPVSLAATQGIPVGFFSSAK